MNINLGLLKINNHKKYEKQTKDFIQEIKQKIQSYIFILPYINGTIFIIPKIEYIIIKNENHLKWRCE